MTVYYVAHTQDPKDLENVKFFTDHASAVSAASEMRGSSVYTFHVNEKCDTNLFGMDTQMLFNKDPESGELRFLASGRWVELHEIMNTPFYCDFEDRGKNFVSMSLKYFLEHYKVVDRKKEKAKPVVKQEKDKIDTNVEVKRTEEKVGSVIDTDLIAELFGGV